MSFVNKRANGERPIVTGGIEFENYTEVSEYLVRHGFQGNDLLRSFVPEVVGGLVVADGREYLRLAVGDKDGLVERSVGGMTRGVSVSTRSLLDASVIVHVERFDNKLLSRGLGWVNVAPEAPPIFQLSIRPGHGVADTSEIADRLEMAEANAICLVEGVLVSETSPLYADRFPGDTGNPNYNSAHSA
jgi:hypothetical protein